MINIAKQIEASTPSRSLLMTYCASLPFFERDVLPYLQQVGDGRVTVLLDSAQYDASFSDLVRGAGTKYRLHPVRLPHKSANFHPKLYLFMDGSKVELLVGSANLTPSGFGSNAEIVDRLTLSKEQEDNAAALAQYADMLRLLPAVDPCLPQQVVNELQNIASDLERRGAIKGQNNLAGPFFLHTIEESLLTQLIRLIPPQEIKEIVAVSPFFDEKSLAVLKLAETYGNAKIRLIKDAQPDSLNGEALKKLGARVTVEEWGTLADQIKRRLHAKLLIFRSNTEEWFVSGSANLTRSAWLSTALSGANIEAVVVRRFSLGSSSRLFKGLSTTKVDHGNLRRAPSTPTNGGDEPAFTIIDAELRGQEIKIEIERHDDSSTGKFRVDLEQGGRRIPLTPATKIAVRRTVLTSSVQTHSVDRDHAISATVELFVPGRQSTQIKAWVAIPGTLAFKSTQRNMRAAARDVCRKAFPQDEAAGAIADAITRFLTDIGDLAHDQVAHKSSKEPAKTEDEADRELSRKDFVIEDEELGALHASHVQTARALIGLAALLEKLLVAADEANDDAPADNVEEEHLEEEDTDDENKSRNDHRKKKVKKAEETLDQLDSAFRSTVSEALHQPVSERAVPFLLNLPSAAIAYVLLHAQLRRRLELDTGYTIAHDLRKILRDALSIDGMALGGSYGWLVRAWASEECLPRLTESIQSNGTTNELIAFVAAGLAFNGPIRDGDAGAQGILAGLHLVIGQVPSKPLGADLRNRLAAVAQASGDVFGVPELEAAIDSFAPEKLNSISAVRCWKALKRIDIGDSNSVSSDDATELRCLAPELWAEYSSLQRRLGPPLCQASATENGLKCGACQMILPSATTQRLATPLPAFANCDFCHRILIPVNVEDGISEKIVRGLESMAEVTHV
jgi:HKD family nuclease